MKKFDKNKVKKAKMNNGRRVRRRKMSDDDRAERIAKYREKFAARSGAGEAPAHSGYKRRMNRGKGMEMRTRGRGKKLGHAKQAARAAGEPVQKTVPPGQAIKQNLMAQVATGKPAGNPRGNAYGRRLRQNKDLPTGVARGRGRGRR